MPSLAALPIAETPVAILDFETTGLSPGRDRVVEVAVVRVAPGEEPRLVLDTLVNPRRRMACTEIHGITDDDAADAPDFGEIADNILSSLSGCALAAYNVYFDVKFLTYELERAGRGNLVPYFCLMYLRPMLDLGNRCTLADACRAYGITITDEHHAAADAVPEAHLYRYYQSVLHERGIHTFGELAGLRSYKFCESFDFDLPSTRPGRPCDRLKPRTPRTPASHAPVPAPRRPAAAPARLPVEMTFADSRQAPLREYWDVLKLVVADLEVTDQELAYVKRKQQTLDLDEPEIRAQHARVFASVIAQFTDDRRIDDRERDKLRRLRSALSRLGWAPGE